MFLFILSIVYLVRIRSQQSVTSVKRPFIHDSIHALCSVPVCRRWAPLIYGGSLCNTLGNDHIHIFMYMTYAA